jgi:DNA polymerase-3 subunit epsilon
MKTAAPCILFEINRCGAPCIGAQSLSSYQEIVARFKNYLEEDFRALSGSFNEKMSELALAERFEEAIEVRDRYGHLLRASSRIERLNSITRIPLIIAAKPVGEFWEFVSIKYGKLAGSNVSTPTTSISAALSALKQLSEEVLNEGFLQQVSYEEVEIILNYLEEDGIRLVEIEGDYVFPAFGPTSTANSFGNANPKTTLNNLSAI